MKSRHKVLQVIGPRTGCGEHTAEGEANSGREAGERGSDNDDGGTGCDNEGVSSGCAAACGMESSCSALGGIMSPLF